AREEERFEHRHEAVEAAFQEAIDHYVPRPYPGRVLLIRSTFQSGPTEGIGYANHESNGWRPLIGGRLTVVKLEVQHHDILSERISPRTAEILKAELAEVRARPENAPQSGERVREGAQNMRVGPCGRPSSRTPIPVTGRRSGSVRRADARGLGATATVIGRARDPLSRCRRQDWAGRVRRCS